MYPSTHVSSIAVSRSALFAVAFPGVVLPLMSNSHEEWSRAVLVGATCLHNLLQRMARELYLPRERPDVVFAIKRNGLNGLRGFIEAHVRMSKGCPFESGCIRDSVSNRVSATK